MGRGNGLGVAHASVADPQPETALLLATAADDVDDAVTATMELELVDVVET